MNGAETERTLDALLYVERMTVRLYDDAIPKVDEPVATKLQTFRDGHQRHERRIGEWSSERGRKPADPSRDVKALVEEHADVLSASRGHPAVIEALLLTERMNAALYDAAEALGPPSDALDIVHAHHDDEHEYIAFLEEHAPVLAAVTTEVTEAGEHTISCLTGGLTDDRNPDDFE